MITCSAAACVVFSPALAAAAASCSSNNDTASLATSFSTPEKLARGTVCCESRAFLCQKKRVSLQTERCHVQHDVN